MDRQAKRRRQEKEVMRTPNWSELPPDLLRCVFERLSFTVLNRAKLVCRLWYSAASRDCVPQNQIPWLIFFPPKGNRCVMLVPEENKLYTIRYLGREFAESVFLRSCGSWFLMSNALKNLYILNPFTGERIDLPVGPEITDPPRRRIPPCCFWIDKKTKDYLVVLPMSKKFTRKGFNKWRDLDSRWSEDLHLDVFYDHKKQKLYIYFFDVNNNNGLVDIWDFSGDMPHLDESVSLPWFHFHLLYERTKIKSNIVVTVSGDILIVQCIPNDWQPWYFLIFKRNQVDNKWEKTNSLGDEALIYDLGITVTANDSILGIKRNSIYLSHFVFDLTTQQKEPLPPSILSCVGPFIRTHWFFPS